MSRIQVTWVVKTENGQVKGPYSTAAILKMIGEGVFSGNEMISKLPDGQWTTISKEPAFYDKLLEALEGVIEWDPQKAQRMEAETVIINRQPQNNENQTEQPKIFDNVKPNFSGPDTNDNIQRPKNLDKLNVQASIPIYIKPELTGISKKIRAQEKESIIDLSSIKDLSLDELFYSLKLPIATLLALLALGTFFLLENEPEPEDKIHLIAPTRTGAAIDGNQLKQKLSESIKLVEADTFESYLDAENKLVELLEGAPNSLEARALLCVVYRELWPYAKQDGQDEKTIASFTQSTRSLNIVSPFGQVCEAVKLYTAGRYNEARSTVEAILDLPDPFSFLPVLYNYKAELLQEEKDLSNAVPYFQKSIEMWAKWLRPKVHLANLYIEQQNYNLAAQVVKDVLTHNPKHREAKFLAGIIEYQGFKNNELAYNLLLTASEVKSKIPRLTESRGLHILAEILVSRGEKKKALDIAQKAYLLNSNNSELKQLVVRLGGSDKIKNEKGQYNEMTFLGDQYVRQGDYLAAQAEFKAAFELNPKNSMAALKAAKALWHLNQSFEAIEWVKKSIQADPQFVTAYVIQADYMSQRFDFSGAAVALTAAARVAPNNYEVLRGLALLEFRKNNMIGSITFGLKAAKSYDGDIDTFILLSKANCALAQSIMPLNKKEIERKETSSKDAIRYATKAIEIDATNSEAQITYAKTLAFANGVDSGINYLNELISRYSYTLDYQIAKAELQKSEDRWSEARLIYEKLVILDPKNKKSWLGLGEANRALGRNDIALKNFLQAAVLDPTDVEALFQAGKLYLDSSRFDDAITQFKRVQSLNPNYPRTYLYIGKAAFFSGDMNAAMDAAKAEKKMNPNVADSYILAAEIYSSRRQYQECASEYSQALKLRSQGADIYVKSAQCYRQAGSLDVAEDMLSLAASRESGLAEIYREQGAIYELKGDARSAATAYNKYLGLSPNAPDHVEIENRLNKLGQ